MVHTVNQCLFLRKAMAMWLIEVINGGKSPRKEAKCWSWLKEGLSTQIQDTRLYWWQVKAELSAFHKFEDLLLSQFVNVLICCNILLDKSFKSLQIPFEKLFICFW